MMRKMLGLSDKDNPTNNSRDVEWFPREDKKTQFLRIVRIDWPGSNRFCCNKGFEGCGSLRK